MFAFGSVRPIRNYYTEEISHDGLTLSLNESFSSFTNYIGDTYIACANLFEYWVWGNDSIQEKSYVIEGFVGDVWEKIKAFFKEMAEKIKSWFDSVVKYFQARFMSAKAFLKKFKDDLTSKSDGGEKFEYKVYLWDLSMLASNPKSETNNALESALRCFDYFEDLYLKALTLHLDINSQNEPDKEVKSAIHNAVQKVNSDVHQAVKKHKDDIDEIFMSMVNGTANGKGGVSKFKEEFKKKIKGGSTEIKSVTGMGKKGASVEQMIDFIENSDEYLSNIKDTTSDVIDDTEKITEKLDKTKENLKKTIDNTNSSKGESGIEYSAVMPGIHGAADVAKYYMTYSTALCEVMKECVQECHDQYLSILRRYATYSPKKESGSGYRPKRSDMSISESWMRF